MLAMSVKYPRDLWVPSVGPFLISMKGSEVRAPAFVGASW